MNARYPDATSEELERESTCIICREEMRVWVEPGADGAQAAPNGRVDERQRPKKLPCGHILHFSCLRSWMERQQVCPTCRRPVLADAPAQANQANNPPNAPQQQLPGNVGGGLGLFGLGGNQGNQQPQQQPAPGQPGAQPNGPRGNMRVFNFGPIRIALGNIRVPNNPANPNAHNEALANLHQRLHQAQHQAQVAQAQNGAQPAGIPGLVLPGAPAAGIPGGAPGTILTDVSRMQDNIINTMRHLQIQHSQLEYIQTLLAELQRLQQAAATGATGQTSQGTTPLAPQWGPPGVQQAYLPTPGVMGPGDPNLPPGLVLPEGWSLRRLAPANQPSVPQEQTPSQPVQPGASQPTSSQVETDSTPSSSHAPSSSRLEPGSSSSESVSSTPKGKERATETQTTPSWSFSDVGGAGGAVASGSNVAGVGSSSNEGNVSRRTAMVEDADDVE